MKNILITGGTGFIGSYILKNLIKNKNYKIFSTYRKKKKIRSKNLSWIKVNNLSSKKLKKKSFDILIDTAWYDLDNFNSTSHKTKQVSEHLYLYKSLLKQNRKISFFIFGTSLEYGYKQGKLIENFRTNPHVNYAIGKDLLRKKTKLLKKKNKFKFTWLRPFYIYGDGQQSRTLYSQFKKSVKNKLVYFKMSSGEQMRDYLSIKKVAKLVLLLIKKNSDFGEVNVCSGKPVKVKDLVNKWKNQMNSKIKIQRDVLNIPKYEPFAFYGCNSKLKKILKLKSIR